MTKKNLLLTCFVIAKFLLQYSLVDSSYELHRDEFLHLDQAHHLAWGYLSVPPFTSWVSYLINLLGNSVFWIRFFPALFGACTLIVVWKAIEALNGRLFALTLGATATLLSILLRLNILYQPNSMDVLAWTGFYYVFLLYTQSGNRKWLFLSAIVFAIGFLNKYNIIFLVIGLLPAFLFTEQRQVFTKKAFFQSILLALLLISPNLWWQYQHHFPVFRHLQELTDTQLVNVSRWDFLKEQALYFFGSLLIIFSALFALLFYPPYRKYRYFFWSFCFTLILFLYLRAKSYYAIGLYPIYLVFGSVYLEKLLSESWGRYLKPVLLLIPILCFIPLYQVGFPNKKPDYILKHSEAYREMGLLRWEDGKNHPLPQDFADMMGWKELARKLDSIYSTLPDPDETLILCDNYGQAGAINYYTKNKKIRAVSFNADYLNWFDLSIAYHHVLRVKDWKGSQEEMAETSPYFEKSVIGGSITNPLAREYGTSIFIFVKAKIDVNERIRQEMKEYK